MTESNATQSTLRVTLPNVVSWSRPRPVRGGVRYPRAYVRNREAWATVVAHAVLCQHWRPPATARYRVVISVRGGGRRDLDRICTAVLDALRGGAALRDDCLVDTLEAVRCRLPRGLRPVTILELTTLPPATRPRGRAAAEPVTVALPSTFRRLP
jgi:Holliday junction resolvase RusA-like endonuclease